VRPSSHPSQIKAIRIPAGHHGDLAFRESQFVIPNRLVQDRKVLVAQVDQGPAQGLGKLGRPLTMSGVASVVFPAAVVQEGEQLDDQRCGGRMLGDAQAVLADSLPVRDAMDAVQVEDKSLFGCANDLLEVGLENTRCGHRFSM